MQVLYLHPTGTFGGASKSLIELFGVLNEEGVQGTLIGPWGSACSAFESAGMHIIPVKGLSQFDNTRFGFYRRARWLILLRELYFLPYSLRALKSLRGHHFDLMHVNEITLLPLAIIAKRFLHIPMIVHVRSLQPEPGSSWRTNLINKWLGRYADAVVAIDQTVAKSLPRDLPLNVVHNGLKLGDKLPSDNRRENRSVCVGFLGVLIPLKGIYELIEAIRILVKERGVAIECVIAGENARQLSGLKAKILKYLGFARDVQTELETLITHHGLQRHIRLLGFVSDVRRLYPQLDILCFPSHLDAAGRPVFEAAFYSVPSIVAISNPLQDAVIDGVTGIAIDRPDPVLIADALQKLVEDPAYRRKLGDQARVWAVENFSIDANAARMGTIYRELISAREPRRCV